MRRSSLKPIFLTIALHYACGPLFAQSEWTRSARPEGIKFPDQEFHPPQPGRVELGNGMVVYLLPDDSIPQVRLRGMVRAGSLHETPDESGLAGLTANLLRLGGTTQVSATEMNRKLEYAGASLEAGAARDSAIVSLRVLSKDLEMGVELLADMLKNPAFPEDKIEQRRGELLETLRRQDDDPMEITRREFRKLLYYGDHPYGRDPLGALDTLPKFSREDLVHWHKTWWGPNRILLAASGDFIKEDLLALLEEEFEGWTSTAAASEYPQVVPPPKMDRIVFIPKELEQSTVRLGHLGITRDNPDAIPLEVMNFILGGGGFSSRMFSQIRGQSGYAYMIVSVFDKPLLQGQFVTIFQTKTDNTLPAIEQTRGLIREYVEQGNMTQEELELAKAAKLNDFVFKFETPSAVVNRFAELEYYGLPKDYLETYRDRLSAVTLDDLRRVAREYLHPDSMTLLVLGHPDSREALDSLGEVEEIQLREPIPSEPTKD